MVGQILPNNNEKCYSNFSPNFPQLNTATFCRSGLAEKKTILCSKKTVHVAPFLLFLPPRPPWAGHIAFFSIVFCCLSARDTGSSADYHWPRRDHRGAWSNMQPWHHGGLYPAMIGGGLGVPRHHAWRGTPFHAGLQGATWPLHPTTLHGGV
jgi:hypothetical protein